MNFVRYSHNNSGCNLGEDCVSSAKRLVSNSNSHNSEPECLDVIHKVVGSTAMVAVHKLLQDRPHCPMNLRELLDSLHDDLKADALQRCQGLV
mmetsp:Transcript_49938/g.91719  ORF Transcript_49938/g.91719 Transcript_49938/m.91719 type:complete len:93 (-) Transcript_49938:80-358(-)